MDTRDTDDRIVCLCFHVSKRKVLQYLRTNSPAKPSQLSECFGAGTGCGWCRPFLEKLWESEQPETVELPSAEDYALQRDAFRNSDQGT